MVSSSHSIGQRISECFPSPFPVSLMQSHSQLSSSFSHQQIKMEEIDSSLERGSLKTKRRKSVQKNEQNEKSKKDLWKKVKNSLVVIKMFQSPFVDEIKTPENLNSYFSSNQVLNASKNTSAMFLKQKPRLKTLQNFRRQQRFFELIKRGRKEDIEELKEIIRNDPDRFCIDMKNPKSIVNRPNALGQTPLGAAVMNGSIISLMFLLEYKADPYIKMRRKAKNGLLVEESLLETAARWKCEEILSFLLTRFEWEAKDLKAAFSASDSGKVKKIIKNKLRKDSCIKKALKSLFSCFFH
jgi:hypothetical protein